VTLYCATSNPGKLREFRLAAGAGLEIVALTGIPPCEETGETFEENAIQKAAYYSRHAAGLLFAEDSGLEVEALSGAPGVRSARFAGEGASDEANNRLLMERLRGVGDRRARYCCAIALAEGGRALQTFHGEVAGEIVHEPRGSNGFGYDPYFLYKPFGLTFAEIAPERKLAVSHRGRAVSRMRDWLLENLLVCHIAVF